LTPAGALRARVRGRVRDDVGTRAAYAGDASIYRAPAGVVVEPADADDLRAAVTAAAELGLTVVTRGAGTSVAGNAIGGDVLLDLRRLDTIEEIDPVARTARVRPGVVLDDLRAAAAPHGLTFGPDPSTHNRCTLGGMIGNNACGSHSVAWGTTADNVVGLDVLLADGSPLTVGPSSPTGWDALVASSPLHRDLDRLVAANLGTLRTGLPTLKRRVSGYAVDRLLPEHGRDLAQALVGTEGTCAIVSSAVVRLVPVPAARVLLVLGFPDVVAAARAVPALLPHGPLTVESVDGTIIALAGRSVARRPDLPAGDAWLLVEMGGESVAAAADACGKVVADVADLLAGSTVVTDAAAQRALWKIREDGAGLATRLPDGSEAWPGWEDAAVPPDRLADYLVALHELLATHGRAGAVYGHFGEGCLHARLDFDLASADGLAGYRSFVEDATDLVVAFGGSVSGEHGDGRARSELLERMFAPEVLRVFEGFKAVFDPEDRLNPGVVVRPRPLDADVRMRQLPVVTGTAFAYPHDAGDFSRAVRRCVGVGRCVVDHPAGVMCPSWQATGDERHSTRGRARILAEMLDGRLDTAGWKSSEVHEALDLCLSCKGCLSDCPVDVDMATYKAEFLHQHYRRRLRPMAHYSLGWLPTWLRLGSRLPAGVASRAARVAGRSRLLRRLAGIDPARAVPAIPARSFRRSRRGPATPGTGTRVVLWPDTFSDHLSPTVLHAATRVLTRAGFAVSMPDGAACCGLTWISTGQLDKAKAVLRRTLDVIPDEPGVPLVVVEPSCAAALRRDLVELLADDPRAARLAARVTTFAEAVRPHADRLGASSPGTRVHVQVHCHQHAVLGTEADVAVLRAAGFEVTVMETGCCGLAGNFGFENGHFEISKRIAEQRLLPALDAVGPGDVVLADGYSCRTQIAELSGTTARHLAELLDEAAQP